LRPWTPLGVFMPGLERMAKHAGCSVCSSELGSGAGAGAVPWHGPSNGGRRSLKPSRGRPPGSRPDGHTNRSAAAEFFLSPNTVATRLRSIFGKLSVKSRAQLTRAILHEN
jgi:hypothetical protein